MVYYILAAVLAVILILGGIYINGFKNWLVWAVSEAENMLGSGTGQLKLRFVYDTAVLRFPIIAKLIPFKLFSKMVDSALVVMRQMIENNANVAAILEKKNDNERKDY